MMVLAANADEKRPTARGVWTPTAPVIDGKMDSQWERAPEYGDLIERKPNLRAKPPVNTRFRVLFDTQALYLLVICEDDEPVRALTRQRDTFDVFRDDALSLKIDPALDGRTTLGFVMNPAGARLDYRGINESDFRSEFDAVWRGAVSQDETGWIAEFEIPLAELGIDPASPPDAIGFNISRDHPRFNATYDWSLMPPPYSPISARLYGRITGLSELGKHSDKARAVERPGTGRTVMIPFVTGGFSKEPDQVAVGEFNVGMDLKADVGGGTSVHLTVNTDFANADLDDQVVNLDRFGLFLPEKRDFFLQDLELFSFGRQGSAQLLHTRRVGLRDGQAVPILGGLKLVARPTNTLRFGVLELITRETAEIAWTSHLVGRGLFELGGGSNIGFMVTHRHNLDEPTDYNLAVGLDGAWRGPKQLPLLLEAFTLLSFTGDGAGQADVATGAQRDLRGKPAPGAHVFFTWQDELVRPFIRYEYYAPGLRTDLGFFRRVDVHTARAGVTIEPRIGSGGLEKVSVNLNGGPTFDGTFDELLDWDVFGSVGVVWDAGWRIDVSSAWRTQTVRSDFTVGKDTVIPAGDYDGIEASLGFSSPSVNTVSGSLTAETQQYFGGWLIGANGSITVQPSALVRIDLGGSYAHALFEDDSRDFDAVTVNGRLTFGFTNDLSLALFSGYNLLGELVQIQTRLRYSFLPGSDLYLVYQMDLDAAAAADATAELMSLLLKSTVRF